MTTKSLHLLCGAALLGVAAGALQAAPIVSRLTPPSLRFSTGVPGAPYVARFLTGQRFDLQATVRPDSGATITAAQFFVDGTPVAGAVTLIPATVSGLPANTVCPTLRAYSSAVPGAHTLKVVATQSDGQTVEATGEFEVIGVTQQGRRAKNLIVMIGDGMGIAHRSAARIAYRGVANGKALGALEMDAMPATALVRTASLNSIITDSAPGAACYSSGNKANNNQQGVFPDDTTAKFDNPRVELIGEYLARTTGKALGIVTTSDVFDATPGAFGSHTQDRGAGTGICDQFLDEAAAKANLRVLMGGGRKWFLPADGSLGAGSARASGSDYVLPAELATGWGVTAGTVDVNRNLVGDFQAAGFSYAPDKTTLTSVAPSATKLLGLFAFSNMNVAKDKIDGRRGTIPAGATQTVVADYGLTDQPLLNEMTAAALSVLAKNPAGFVLMVEGASIDKQAHNMDSERWLLDTIEFDKAIGVAKQFVANNPDTLVYVTADHECAGVNIIGASTVTNSVLQARAAAAGGAAQLRDATVGTYEAAGFPFYTLAADGFPVSTDVDYKMLIGYAANSDRYEDWLTNPYPLKDSQQVTAVFPAGSAYATYPAGPINRDTAGGFLITGQVPGSSAVHTGSDVPLTATGRGASLFAGVIDNTDAFFLSMQAVLGGAK